MNYEVILLPALYVLAALAVVITLIRGVTREVTGVAEDGLKTVRWGYRVRNLKVAAVILVAAAVVIPALVVTPPGHRGVIYSQSGGIDLNERPEGLSFVIPYFQTPHQVNVRSQKLEVEAFAQTADLQEVTVKASINYHVAPTLAAELYQGVGSDYAAILIAPAALQRLLAEVGLIEAEFFASSRNALAVAIVSGIESQLGAAGIVVEYVNIEDALFQPEFITAVQNKVIAKQLIETTLRGVQSAENIADQVVATADGEAAAILTVATAQAQANDLLDASLTSDVLKWTRIGAWDGVLPTTLLGASDALNALIEIGAN